jgi:hypothetical protein
VARNYRVPGVCLLAPSSTARLAGGQAEQAAGDGGAQPGWLAGETGGAFLAADSGPENGERNGEDGDDQEG